MTKTISKFREVGYQKVTWRSGAISDLIDALTVNGHVNSPVVLSESPLFRRKFSSVYDANGQILAITNPIFAGERVEPVRKRFSEFW